MASATAVAETAIFTVLDAGISGATVYQDAPENADLPLVIIGDMKSAPLGGKDDADRRIALTIVSMVDAEERAPLLALQEQIEQLLAGKTLTSDGWTLGIGFDDADAALGGDGVTYIGTSNFTILALGNA